MEKACDDALSILKNAQFWKSHDHKNCNENTIGNSFCLHHNAWTEIVHTFGYIYISD